MPNDKCEFIGNNSGTVVTKICNSGWVVHHWRKCITGVGGAGCSTDTLFVPDEHHSTDPQNFALKSEKQIDA